MIAESENELTLFEMLKRAHELFLQYSAVPNVLRNLVMEVHNEREHELIEYCQRIVDKLFP